MGPKFSVKQVVVLPETGQRGTVIGVYTWINAPRYEVRYASSNGAILKDWFDEAELSEAEPLA